MGGLFPKPKPIVMPEVKELEPPEIIAEEIQPDKKKRKGREETIITGDLEPATTGKTLLG